MKLIDKEKLVDEYRKLGYYEGTQLVQIAKNFPEVEHAKRELPVKKVFTIKPEILEIFTDFGHIVKKCDYVEDRRLKYYDVKEEIDYSAIPKCSVVEFFDGRKRTVVKVDGENFDYTDAGTHEYSERITEIKRVVEWGDEK
jgi:hypothetical protein